jgi:hypothetical protein
MSVFSKLFGGPKIIQLESDPESVMVIQHSELSPKFFEEMAAGIFVTGPFKFVSRAVLSHSSDQLGKPRFAVKSGKGNFVGFTLLRDNEYFENLFKTVSAIDEKMTNVSEIGIHLTVEGDIDSSEISVEWATINWKGF